MRRTLIAWTLASLSLTACIDDSGGIEDGIDDAIPTATEGKADTGGINPYSLDARAIVKFANTASRSKLLAAGLSTRVVDAILDVRTGDDGVTGTSDDVVLGSVREFDAIAFVGPSVFEALASPARAALAAAPQDCTWNAQRREKLREEIKDATGWDVDMGPITDEPGDMGPYLSDAAGLYVLSYRGGNDAGLRQVALVTNWSGRWSAEVIFDQSQAVWRPGLPQDRLYLRSGSMSLNVDMDLDSRGVPHFWGMADYSDGPYDNRSPYDFFYVGSRNQTWPTEIVEQNSDPYNHPTRYVTCTDDEGRPTVISDDSGPSGGTLTIRVRRDTPVFVDRSGGETTEAESRDHVRSYWPVQRRLYQNNHWFSRPACVYVGRELHVGYQDVLGGQVARRHTTLRDGVILADERVPDAWNVKRLVPWPSQCP